MNRRIFAPIGSAVVTTGLSLIAPIAAMAQSTQGNEAEGGSLQEVVVTAQRRSEAAVDVPITIAAIDTQQLATANVQDLRDIAQLTPSIRSTTMPASSSRPSV